MAQGSHYDDNLFATEAIRRGYISVAQLEEAKEVQKKLSEIGITEPLSNVMVKRNYISKQQMDALMAGEKDGGKVTIPGYKVISKIGRGGMGTVYKATQLSIGRPVAIKVLSSRLVQDDPNYVERFTREAKNLATLNHVNIVSAIDAGKVGNVMYYVMEFIEGESLGDILKKRDRLPEQEALHIVMQVTRALEHAQEHEIIHRDIKPDNILITSDGVAKVTDLGLAKSKGEDANLTQTGIAIGTPNYISPEQARGERDLDTRADIYSLGATLYHMVVGEAPFKGSSALEVVTKHLTEQLPSPKTLNPDLSDGLCLVIEKMMAKKRDDRYQGPKELLGDLELVIDGKMPKASKLSVGRSSIMRRVSVGAAAKPAAEKKGQTARVSNFSKGVHSTATLTMSARGKNQWILPVSIAAGVLLLFIIIAVASGGKGPEQPAPVANYQPVRPSKPAVSTPVVTETPKPPAGKPVQEDKPKPVAARSDDRPPSPTPAPREPELNVPSRPTDAASQKVAELTSKERTLIDDINKNREERNFRNALSAASALEKVNDEGKQYPSYIVLGDEFRKKVNEEASEDFNKMLLFVEEKLGSDKESLQRMKENVSKDRSRFPDDFGKKFDALAGRLDTAIKEYDKPENALKRDKYLFETVYNQQIKWLLDMPRLNYPEAREVVKRELIEPNKIRHEEVKKSIEALKKDFDAVAGLIDRLRKVGEINDDNHHMKISWPEKRKESYENPEPSQSLIMVKVNDGERGPASPEALELIAKAAFKEKPSREMIQAALLLYAYSGCPKDTIMEMMKQQKIDDKNLAKRLDEIATSAILPCEFGAKLSRPDFLAFAGGGAAADNKPIAAQVDNKAPPKDSPKISYNERKLFERGRPTTDMKKKLDGLADDTFKESGEGAFSLATIKGSDKKKLLVLSEEKEEVENCELAVVFRNDATERTRFIFRAEMDGDKIRNGIVFEVKVEGGDKGKIHGKVKLHKFEEGKFKECIDEKQFETRERAVAADDFVFLFFRIQFDPKKKADRVDMFVNLPNVAAAAKDEPEATFVRKDIAGKGIAAVELPNLEEHKGETKALMIRDLRLKRLKP